MIGIFGYSVKNSRAKNAAAYLCIMCWYHAASAALPCALTLSINMWIPVDNDRIIRIQETDSLYVREASKISVSPNGKWLGIIERSGSNSNGYIIDAVTGTVLRQYGPSYDFSDSLANSLDCSSMNGREVPSMVRKARPNIPEKMYGYHMLVPSETYYSDSSRLPEKWIRTDISDIQFGDSTYYVLGITGGVAADSAFIFPLQVRSISFVCASNAYESDRTYYPLAFDKRGCENTITSSVLLPEETYMSFFSHDEYCVNTSNGRVLIPFEKEVSKTSGSAEKSWQQEYLDVEVDPKTLSTFAGLKYPVAPNVLGAERYYISVVPCISKAYGYKYVINGLPNIYDRNGNRLFGLDTLGLGFPATSDRDTLQTPVFKKYREQQHTSVIALSETNIGETVVILRLRSAEAAVKHDLLVQKYSVDGKKILSKRFSSSPAREYTSATYHANGNSVYVVSFVNEAWTIEVIRL
jgi:hypothetical protein